MKYRAEIDGLRALAVLPVILFHAGFEWFSGGFVGVDVFFVISGYLITTIIISEMAEGKFSIVNFYERRARRILPALFFVMAACLPFAWVWLTPNDLKDFGQSLVAVSTFSSNILFWLESGYFDRAAELKPLLHTWSLAVEEQYYILFPIFLTGLVSGICEGSSLCSSTFYWSWTCPLPSPMIVQNEMAPSLSCCGACSSFALPPTCFLHSDLPLRLLTVIFRQNAQHALMCS